MSDRPTAGDGWPAARLAVPRVASSTGGLTEQMGDEIKEDVLAAEARTPRYVAAAGAGLRARVPKKTLTLTLFAIQPVLGRRALVEGPSSPSSRGLGETTSKHA